MIITATGIFNQYTTLHDPVARLFAVTGVNGVTLLEKGIPAPPKQFVLCSLQRGIYLHQRGEVSPGNMFFLSKRNFTLKTLWTSDPKSKKA